MSAFLDTSGLYALLVSTEEDHAAVVQAFQDLLADRRTLWTTSYVLVETVALLQHRIGLAPVRDFMENLVPLFSIEWVTEALHRKAVERLLREERRKLSLVDCVSLEFMAGLGLRDVLALDAPFAEAGHRLHPAAWK